MSMQFSRIVSAQTRGMGLLSVKSIDLHQFGEQASPVALLDDFSVNGAPFGPHPHAGFSAITYVFEDSPSALRSRDSLGHDLTIHPGGIVWLQAARGAMHEETPAENGCALKGAQIYVNLTAKNKLAAPQTFWLEAGDIPEVSTDEGDRVRVLVGSYGDVSSSMVPVEPFTLLDAHLHEEISFDLQDGHNAVVYVRDGSMLVCGDGREQLVTRGAALAMSGTGEIKFHAVRPTQILVLSGPAIHEPVFADGPFIMNEPAQIAEAMVRYRAGEMGYLASRQRVGVHIDTGIASR